MIDINLTIVIQLVNFIVTLVVLNFLLIKPVRGIIRQRRDLAAGFLGDAERFNSEAATRLERYEAVLTQAREQGAAERETQKTAALQQESAMLAAAHTDAQDFLQQSREETRKAVAAAGRDLRAQIPALAAKAAERLLRAKA